MSTALDVISGALTAIGQLGQGQTASPEDGALGLRLLNLMLSQASTKRLMLFFESLRQYTLQANVADYTIGPTGATFIDTRPVLLESCQCNVPGSQYWAPVNVLDKAKFEAIPNRAATDEVITSVYPEYQFPNMVFHVHPKPIGTPNIRFGAWEVLTKFVTLFDTVAFPEAYEEWMESNLAIMLAPYYDQPVPAALAQRAAEGKAAVMEYNAQSLGGALTAAQKMETVNVGAPIPQAPAGAPQ